VSGSIEDDNRMEKIQLDRDIVVLGENLEKLTEKHIDTCMPNQSVTFLTL